MYQYTTTLMLLATLSFALLGSCAASGDTGPAGVDSSIGPGDAGAGAGADSALVDSGALADAGALADSGTLVDSGDSDGTGTDGGVGDAGVGLDAANPADGATGSDGSTDAGSPCPGDAPILPTDIGGSITLVPLAAADGTEISVGLYEGAAQPCTPAVLLVHQFQHDKWQWGDLPDQLQAAGLIVLTLDLRGHGDSGAQKGALSDLLTDPDQAPTDVAAALAFLTTLQSVDPARVAVVGTSIGANLAVVAQVKAPWVRAIVPISPRDTAIGALSGQAPPWAVSRMLCLATEDDGGGAQAATCKALLDGAKASDSTVWPGSAHGISILEDIPEAAPAVIDWLLTRL